MITVTKPFLPPRSTLNKYLDKIYETNWLTNFGPLEQALTAKLKDFLEVENLLLISNGTLALQILYKALDLKGEVITTPFSFVATTSSLKWENLSPRFVDIDKDSLNIDPYKIAEKINTSTSAILPVHVYGRIADVWKIQEIAEANNLRTIYDAAHAFNIKTYENKNVASYGDASILSFHATKLFHTIEGGAIITQDPHLLQECRKLINFGITGYESIEGIGINAKMHEFSAAMGLAVLENINEIQEARKAIFDIYQRDLPTTIQLSPVKQATLNYSYYPILLPNESTVIKLQKLLLENNIMPRRYFYPVLNALSYVTYEPCPIAEDISKRILCLPLYSQLTAIEAKKIIHIVISTLESGC